MQLPDLALPILLGLIGAIVLAAIVSRFEQVTIYEFQQGLRYRDGRFIDLVGPGRYRIYRPTTRITPVDVRTTVYALPGQELVTSDGVSVRLSLAVQQRIADPVKALHGAESFREAIYSLLQVALREVVSGMGVDDLLARRTEIGPDVLARTIEPAKAFGIELVDVSVRDLMLPAATKRIFGQVVEARQRGLAALEKARGETAALRSLSNAARMVDANPSLLQLRMLQQLEGTSGNTVLLGMPPNSTPVPIRELGETTESSPRRGVDPEPRDVPD